MTSTCSHRTSHLTLTSDDVAGHYGFTAHAHRHAWAVVHYSTTAPRGHYSTTALRPPRKADPGGGTVELTLASSTTATILYSTLHHPSA